jgi:hypothetical protein
MLQPFLGKTIMSIIITAIDRMHDDEKNPERQKIYINITQAYPNKHEKVF